MNAEMPTWEGFMLPSLRALSDGEIRHRRELMPLVAGQVGLTEQQRSVVLSSGQPMYENRIGWALSYLTNVGALDRPSRGNYRIAEAGRGLLERFPEGLRERDVSALAEDRVGGLSPYVAAPRATSAVLEGAPAMAETSGQAMTPLEQVEEGVDRIHRDVALELLQRLRGKEPAFFEQAVVDLLLAMGYGGTLGSGAVTQLSNDGGIDGVIDQDHLGLSRIYIQAKRYSEGVTVGRPEVQGFVGAVHGRADSGVFITTSHFSKGAREFADMTPTRIILIDGARLTDLMIRFGVGVQIRETYKVVEIDEDFFA
ncbi:restriction endonuclease [Tessaracoccus aquimaris]|uniref:Restriction endonuclease n=1 Tax=Tessaracoccus aquimaris TaxID=1332264 RepID=A0A1Q2CQT7_9ACTN|nr:restriction endonuclease [Tessaracoccus aquimaris]AQP48483.1 restriction endonuclease [Tessaracoccus aquimaris]